MAPSFSDHSSTWDMKSFVVDEGHGVKGLAEMNFKSLPSQYIQPVSERLDMSSVVYEESIPVIDMSDYDDQRMAHAICRAAENWGFFQIINHGVPSGVLDNVKRATHRFFELPAQEKKKHLYENSPTKHVRFGTSFIPQAENALEWKDYLSCFYVSDNEAMTFWPSACRNEMLEYMNESEPLIRKLVDVLMRGLNISEVDEEDRLILTGSKRININYYPKCPNPELAIGVGRHSDVSTLTILLQDDIGGLYVRKLETDAWVHVKPISGSLIINVGDALQIISNGRYKSVEHRVVANGTQNRISVPIFVNPRPTDIIGPHPRLVKEGEKALYKQVLYSDYVKHFFRKAHDGKGTVEFVKIQ